MHIVLYVIKALRLSGKLNEALETIKTARSLDPVNNDICSELAEIEKYELKWNLL